MIKYIIFSVIYLLFLGLVYFFSKKEEEGCSYHNLLISCGVLLGGNLLMGYLFNRFIIGIPFIKSSAGFIFVVVFLMVNIFSFYQVFADFFYLNLKNNIQLIIGSIISLITLIVSILIIESFDIFGFNISNMSIYFKILRELIFYSYYIFLFLIFLYKFIKGNYFSSQRPLKTYAKKIEISKEENKKIDKETKKDDDKKTLEEKIEKYLDEDDEEYYEDDDFYF